METVATNNGVHKDTTAHATDGEIDHLYAWWPLDVPQEAPPAPCALPEAPASVNCHLTIAGRQVQLTLRDHDEGALMVRLEALLQRYGSPKAPGPPQAPAPEPERRFCPKDGQEMTLNHKDGRSWWSHRRPEGGWCRGR